MQKKLMLLGGSRYLMPVIKAAHDLDCYVITCDYLPDNYAHKFSDEYANVSIIDKDAVLAKAQELKIDGIMSFACDPGVVTAAYVAEKMGLPTPPLESVEILQNKDKFRDFLAKNGFNCPFHFSYTADEEPLQDANLRQKLIQEKTPVIVKPVDSAGSKGCSRVDSIDGLANAVDYARSESHNGRIIIEQFLELQGHQTGSDSFSIDNELVFCSFDSQYFDATASNPYAPVAHIWPSDMPLEAQTELTREIQRLIKLLNLGTSIYNIEARVAQDGKPYIMEISPRGGGNRLAEILKFATGQDLIKNAVKFAIGLKCDVMSSPSPRYDGIWVDYVVHASASGTLQFINFDPSFVEKKVQMMDIYVKPGEKVNSFSGANRAIGHLFMKFASIREAVHSLEDVPRWETIRIE